MALTRLNKSTKLVVPTKDDIQLAKESSKKLSQLDFNVKAQVFKLVLSGDKRVEIQLSKTMFLALMEIIDEIAAGKAITLVPVDAELTTQQAANMLNVSRPYFVKLLDEGKIPCRTVGRYRRVRYEDLLKYQQLVDARRQSAMDSLIAQAQELGLGY